MKNYEYLVNCKTFEGNIIDGSEFDKPLYGSDYYMDYKPTLVEIEKAYGKGWDLVTEVNIATIPENVETSEDYTWESHKVNQ